MFKKTYGLVYRKGRWHIKNYGRVLKKGGMFGLEAHMRAWWNNRVGEKPAPTTKKKGIPAPWDGKSPKEHYEQTLGPDLEPGDLVAFMRESSPFIKVSWDEPGPKTINLVEKGDERQPLPENERCPPPFEDFRVTDGKHLLPSEHDMEVLRKMGKLAQESIKEGDKAVLFKPKRLRGSKKEETEPWLHGTEIPEGTRKA